MQLYLVISVAKSTSRHVWVFYSNNIFPAVAIVNFEQNQVDDIKEIFQPMKACNIKEIFQPMKAWRSINVSNDP